MTMHRFQDTPAAEVETTKRTLKDYAGQRVCVHGHDQQRGRSRDGIMFNRTIIHMRLDSDPAHFIDVPTSSAKIIEQLQAQPDDCFPFTAMLLISDEGILHFAADPKEGPLEKTGE